MGQWSLASWVVQGVRYEFSMQPRRTESFHHQPLEGTIVSNSTSGRSRQASATEECHLPPFELKILTGVTFPVFLFLFHSTKQRPFTLECNQQSDRKIMKECKLAL